MQQVEKLAHVSAMGYLRLGAQTPFQTNHLISGQQTASIAASCKDDSTIAIVRPSVRSFVSKMGCKNITLLLVNYDNSFSEEELSPLPGTKKRHPSPLRPQRARLPLLLRDPHPDRNPFPPSLTRDDEDGDGRSDGEAQPHRVEDETSPDPCDEPWEDPRIKSFFHFERRRLDVRKYLEKLAEFRYVLSPRGAGFDTFRAWETISVGGCPILVKDEVHSTLVYEGTCSVLLSRMEDLTDPGFVSGLFNRSRVHRRESTKQLVSHWRREVER